MFTQSDYDRLKQIMEESPEKEVLLSKLLETHKMEISSLSHEIRNPLTLVYSTLQLIEASHPEVLKFRHWDSLRHDIEYMSHLLNELSAYNNSERLLTETIHTDTFLKETALSFAASLTDTNVEFTSRIDPGIPDMCCDRVKLRQILLNLLGNARDAVMTDADMQPSGAAETSSRRKCGPSISLCAYTNLKDLIITVTDNGRGISPDIIDTIFEPFTTYKKNGTGLGLPIARRIASAHGGSLTASSQPGISTVFTLTLPIEQKRQEDSH